MSRGRVRLRIAQSLPAVAGPAAAVADAGPTAREAGSIAGAGLPTPKPESQASNSTGVRGTGPIARAHLKPWKLKGLRRSVNPRPRQNLSAKPHRVKSATRELPLRS